MHINYESEVGSQVFCDQLISPGDNRFFVAEIPNNRSCQNLSRQIEIFNPLINHIIRQPIHGGSVAQLVQCWASNRKVAKPWSDS